MIEQILLLSFCVIMISLFSLNFNKRYSNKNYEKLKFKNSNFWFKTFKIEESKEKYINFQKNLSVFVIVIMMVAIISLLMVVRKP